MTPDQSYPKSPATRDDGIASIQASTWWAYHGPYPGAPHVRAVIEVRAHPWQTFALDLPDRPWRNVFLYAPEIGDIDHIDAADRLLEMSEVEFQQLVAQGDIVPLAR